MTVEIYCRQCNDDIIGNTPELGDGLFPAAKATIIVSDHYQKNIY